MFPHITDDRLIIAALLLASLFGPFWWWNRSAKKWLEENHRLEIGAERLGLAFR